MKEREEEIVLTLEKALYEHLESQLEAIKNKTGEDIISILKKNAKEICIAQDEKIDALVDLEDESIEGHLNLASSYLMLALIFHVSDDEFFEDNEVIDV